MESVVREKWNRNWEKKADKNSQGQKKKKRHKRGWVQHSEINGIREIYNCSLGAKCTVYHPQIVYLTGIIWNSTVHDHSLIAHRCGKTLCRTLKDLKDYII